MSIFKKKDKIDLKFFHRILAIPIAIGANE
jgi:hypothetical protein